MFWFFSPLLVAVAGLLGSRRMYSSGGRVVAIVLALVASFLMCLFLALLWQFVASEGQNRYGTWETPGVPRVRRTLVCLGE